MSGTQVFLILFAIASVAVCVLAIWRVARAPGLGYKPLWILGCLFGFVGFGASLNTPGDLYLQFGIQIPVILIRWFGGGEVVLKALFPVVAAVALVKFHPPGTPQVNEHSDLDDTFR